MDTSDNFNPFDLALGNKADLEIDQSYRLEENTNPFELALGIVNAPEQNPTNNSENLLTPPQSTERKEFARISDRFFSYPLGSIETDALSNFSSHFSFFNFFSEFSAKASIILPQSGIQTVTVKEKKFEPKRPVNLQPISREIQPKPAAAKSAIHKSNVFAVLGHIDSGKSTLIGQLLHKTGGLDEKTIEKYRREAKSIGKGTFEYAWALDESKEERARGVTKDINTVCIQFDNSTITLIDCPGHKDFVPNAVHGIMQADAGLLVVDVSVGEFETGLTNQTKEHLLLLRSFGLENNLVIALNKADKISWSEERLSQVKEELEVLLESLSFKAAKFVPVSALKGENLTSPSTEQSPCLLSVLTSLNSADKTKCNADKELRIMVTDVTQTSSGASALQGIVCQGTVKKRDKLVLLPSGEQVYVKTCYLVENDKKAVDFCTAGQNILVVPQNSEFLSSNVERGSILAPVKHSCSSSNCFEAEISTFDLDNPILFGSEVLIYIHGMELVVKISKLYSSKSALNPQDVGKNLPRMINSNSIAIIELKCSIPIPLDTFESVNQLGIFLLRSRGTTIATGRVLKIK